LQQRSGTAPLRAAHDFVILPDHVATTAALKAQKAALHVRAVGGCGGAMWRSRLSRHRGRACGGLCVTLPRPLTSGNSSSSKPFDNGVVHAVVERRRGPQVAARGSVRRVANLAAGWVLSLLVGASQQICARRLAV